MTTKYKNIDEYINTCPAELQDRLRLLRELIKKSAPNAMEKISWNMPTFYRNGNLIHFFLHKHHIGLYPGAEAVEYFKEKLADFKTSKGAIQLPNDKPLPKALIEEIVKYNVTKKVIKTQRI
jgi:uncharacterized protein YdhG (YjbR/CyaY superfamily)